MGIERLLEVGIAVKGLDESIKFFSEVLRLGPGKTDTYERYGMRYHLAPLGDVYFEFIESTDPEGPIGKTIDSRGEGIHHIAFKVTDLDETMAQLREIGVEFIEETPLFLDVVYGRVKFTFIRPRFFQGVLIELIEVL